MLSGYSLPTKLRSMSIGSGNTVEAHALAGGDNDNDTIPHPPPVDRGPGAWKFLFGSFVINASLWGTRDCKHLRDPGADQ